jgi:hypothetical protein
MKYIILALFFISCHSITKKQETIWEFEKRLDVAANCKKPQRDSLQLLKDSLELKMAAVVAKNHGDEDYSKWKFNDLNTYRDYNMKIIWLSLEQVRYMHQEIDSIRAVKTE